MIMKQFCHAILACGVFAAVVAAVSCTKDATGGGGGGYDGEPEVNHDMDGILRRNYLWNEEYATLSPDFGLPYDEFLDGVLMRMRTNDLDKKFRNGRWQLYSNIQRLSPVSRTALSADIDSQFPKEPVYGFGIVSLAIISYTDNGGAETGQYGFAVMAVYPDSPMARAGLGRGTIINQVDGQWITAGNLNTVYSKLLAPNGAATLSVADNQGGFGVSEHKLTAELIYENPVLYRDVLEYGEHKIGYLVYASFDAAFDGELLDALQAFKDAGINDLILDLRLNGGGYVMSSRMLASCIAGARCEGQVFQYYRYNDTRMASPEMMAAETGQAYDESKGRFYEEFIYGDYRGADLRGYALNLPRLYVIVSSGTASASEAVVNGLRGIGLEVVLVGQKTNGKNVGMEGVYLEDGAYEYLFMPVSFQGYNARLETVDPNGLAPDALKADWNNGYEEFGSLDDDCLEYAVTSITGQSVRSSEPAAQRRPGVRLVEGLSLPEISCRPEGMILLLPDAVRKD